MWIDLSDYHRFVKRVYGTAQRVVWESKHISEFDLTFGDVLLHKLVQAYYFC